MVFPPFLEKEDKKIQRCILIPFKIPFDPLFCHPTTFHDHELEMDQAAHWSKSIEKWQSELGIATTEL